MSPLSRFEIFLAEIDMKHHREKYNPIKLVECDLPRDIQALKHIYDLYWEKREEYISWKDFYKCYKEDLKKQLEDFRIERRFSHETFYRGLPARIYRTWISLLTQIQAAYLAESIVGIGKVEMSAELDWRGKDMVINNGNGSVNLQIRKESFSREVRQPHTIKRRTEAITVITYEVSPQPLTPKKRKESKPFLDWKQKWQGKLKRLDNGFIIFQPDIYKGLLT